VSCTSSPVNGLDPRTKGTPRSAALVFWPAMKDAICLQLEASSANSVSSPVAGFLKFADSLGAHKEYRCCKHQHTRLLVSIQRDEVDKFVQTHQSEEDWPFFNRLWSGRWLVTSQPSTTDISAG
jgi:hypothetical protein